MVKIFPFEDYSQGFALAESGKPVLWKGCSNTNVISEDSLSRTLHVIESKTFAILSAYRKFKPDGQKMTKLENVVRNRKLRAIFNSKKMGVHQLIGHWLEDVDGKGLKEDTVERSYLVAKPAGTADKDFCSLIVKCLTIDGLTQDAALIHFETKPGYYLVTANDKISDITDSMKVGDKVSLGKIGQAYSHHVKKLNVPFKFEGEEIPQNIAGKMLYAKAGYCWNGNNWFENELD